MVKRKISGKEKSRFFSCLDKTGQQIEALYQKALYADKKMKFEQEWAQYTNYQIGKRNKNYTGTKYLRFHIRGKRNKKLHLRAVIPRHRRKDKYFDVIIEQENYVKQWNLMLIKYIELGKFVANGAIHKHLRNNPPPIPQELLKYTN